MSLPAFLPLFLSLRVYPMYVCPFMAGIPYILCCYCWYTPNTVMLCDTPNTLCFQSLCTLCILSCHRRHSLYTVMSPGTPNKLCCQCLYVYPVYSPVISGIPYILCLSPDSSEVWLSLSLTLTPLFSTDWPTPQPTLPSHSTQHLLAKKFWQMGAALKIIWKKNDVCQSLKHLNQWMTWTDPHVHITWCNILHLYLIT